MHCEICEEAQTGSSPRLARLLGKAHQSRLVWSNENFFAVPSIAPIVPGHLVLFTKRHYPSMASAFNSLPDQEFDDMVNTTKRWNAKNPLLVWEHGGEGTKCGISHAHINIVPLDHQKLPTFILRRPNRDFWETVKSCPTDKVYLVVGCLEDAVIFLESARRTVSEETSSQFMRRQLITGWNLDAPLDWKFAPKNDPRYQNSAQRCKGLFS